MKKCLAYIGIIFLLEGCIQHGNGTVSDNDTALFNAGQPIEVSVAIAREEIFSYDLPCSGLIVAAYEQSWKAANNGRLIFFSGKNGTHYNRGDLIAGFDNTMLKLRLQRANLNRFNSQREYESQLLGYAALLKDRPSDLVDSIKKKLRINSGLSLVEQDIAEATHEMEGNNIRAPFSGILANVNVVEGKFVNDGDMLFTLYSDRELFLDVEILETELLGVKERTPVEVHPVRDTATHIKGFVKEVNPYVGDNGLVKVRVAISSSARGQMLFPGMHCAARIKVPTRKCLVIPKEGVINRNGRMVVFTHVDGLARWNDVELGGDNGRLVEITKGLTAGAEVIVSNNLQLAQDSPIRRDSIKK